MREILFVCTGNTCRSPMAAALLRDELARRGLDDVTVRSAGLAALCGAAASEYAIEALAEEGIDLSGHAGARVDAEALSRAETVYTMSEAHRRILAGEYPQFAAKLRVLGDGIDDPFGGGIEDYRATRDTLRRHTDAIAQELCDGK